MDHSESLYLNQPRPQPLVLLDLWLDYASSDPDPIGISESVYRYVWNTWLKYLGSGKNGSQDSAIEWHLAEPADVSSFLRAGMRAAKKREHPSDVTRRRYWRLLHRIYQFAHINGWVASNPAAQLGQREIPPPEDPRGSILLPKLWDAAVEILANAPALRRPVAVRNRAICLAFFDLALMPVEVRTLPVSAPVRSQNASGEWEIAALQIIGERPPQQRRLVLPPNSRQAFADWLGERAGFIVKTRQESTLFCTRVAQPITMMQYANIIAALLQQASLASGYPLPARTGPQVVRNTRIVKWLNEGVPPSQVAVWAGLKTSRGLYHLRQHVNPEVNLLAQIEKDSR